MYSIRSCHFRRPRLELPLKVVPASLTHHSVYSFQSFWSIRMIFLSKIMKMHLNFLNMCSKYAEPLSSGHGTHAGKPVLCVEHIITACPAAVCLSVHLVSPLCTCS